jgi:hypothetical protein
MEKKSFTFSMTYEFITDNEQEAKNQFQEMLDSWDESILDAGNWNVREEIVDVSEPIKP